MSQAGDLGCLEVLGIVATSLICLAADPGETSTDWSVGLGVTGIFVTIAQISAAYFQFKTAQVKAKHDHECALKIMRAKVSYEIAVAERDAARAQAERWRERALRLGDTSDSGPERQDLNFDKDQ